VTELHFFSGDQRRPLTLLRNPRARRLRLVVDPRDGTVRLTLPARAPLGPALSWVETKRSWVEAQLLRVPGHQPIVPGMMFSVAGDAVRLDWSPRHPRTPVRIGETVRIGGPEEMVAERLLRWLKREAKALLEAESHEFARLAKVSVTQVGVGDPVSRWGSCAASGAIRYSWRLILAPSFVRRATVAHEVAHRVHMNHAPAFHALVAEILGADPTPARRWLRAHGSELHGFGRAA
jgi:predicted metal-dependent hydrolase